MSVVQSVRGGTRIPIDLESVAEARLVAQALAGSQPAYEQILRRYQRPVLGFLYRLTGDRALAEDLAQETFLKAFRSLAAFDVNRRLSSWILRIAHNTAIDALRKLKPGSTVPLDDTPAALGLLSRPAADPVERRALGEALHTALATLRPEHRAALALRYDEGLSFAEVGRILGIPEVTARSHAHRARKELARLLTDAGWNPEAS